MKRLAVGITALAVLVAMARPADDSKTVLDEMRRELSSLRAQVQRQQQELAELKAAKTAALED